MFKCNVCDKVFESPKEFNEGIWTCERPSGNGSDYCGGGSWEGCPECESADYSEVEFDGQCIYCRAEILPDWKWSKDDTMMLKCEKCQRKFYIDNGEIYETGDVKKISMEALEKIKMAYKLLTADEELESEEEKNSIEAYANGDMRAFRNSGFETIISLGHLLKKFEDLEKGE